MKQMIGKNSNKDMSIDTLFLMMSIWTQSQIAFQIPESTFYMGQHHIHIPNL